MITIILYIIMDGKKSGGRGKSKSYLANVKE